MEAFLDGNISITKYYKETKDGRVLWVWRLQVLVKQQGVGQVVMSLRVHEVETVYSGICVMKGRKNRGLVVGGKAL